MTQSAPESVGRFVGRTFAPLKAAAAFAFAFLGEGLAFASAAFSARTVFPRATPPAVGMGLGGDQYVVILRNTLTQMVYKHAISTVVPSRAVAMSAAQQATQTASTEN